jgi:hypothetical protein
VRCVDEDYAGQAPPQRQYRDVPDTDAGTKSIGEALGDVTRDLTVLFQQKWRLPRPKFARRSTRPARQPGCSPAPPWGSDEDDRGALGTVTDRASAAQDAVAEKAYAARDTVSEKASQAGEAVREAPATVKRKAQGNPIAAG